MAAGQVSTTLSEWLLVVLIVFSLLFEFFLHRLEQWVHSRHHHLFSVVRVLYRELMVLGLVSFSFIVYELIAKPSGNVVLSFEFAHIFIFLLAIFYTFVVLSTMFISLRLSARWKKMERMDLVHYLSLKDKYMQLRSVALRRHDTLWHLIWWFPNVKQLLTYIHMHDIMAFHDIRFQFIYYRNLPEDFRFSSFLRKIKAITFIDLVESHWSLYCIFLVIVLCDIFRRIVISGESITVRQIVFRATTLSTNSIFRAEAPETEKEKLEFDTTESIFIICAAAILGLFTQILALKVRRVYWRLTKHPRMYYESVQAADVEEELRRVAEQRAKESRERRRSRSISQREETLDTGNEADDEANLRTWAPAPNQDMVPFDASRKAPKSLSTPLMSPKNSVDGAGAVVNPGSSMGANAGASGSGSGSGAPGMMTNGVEEVIRQIGMRHSLERPRTTSIASPPETSMKRAMTDLAPTSLAQQRFASSGTGAIGSGGSASGVLGSNGSGTQLQGRDIVETVTRHSLEAPRGLQSPPSLDSAVASSASTTSASLARAAVEAARKRSLADGGTTAVAAAAVASASATSCQSQSSQQQPRGGSDSGLASPKRVMGSQMSSRRGSIEEDTLRPSFGDVVRSSIDSRGRKGGQGGRISVELAVVMPRNELAAHFEEDLVLTSSPGLAEDDFDKTTPTPRDASSSRRRSLSPGSNSGSGHTNDNQVRFFNTVDPAAAAAAARKEQRIRFNVDAATQKKAGTSGNGDICIDLSQHGDNSKVIEEDEDVSDSRIRSSMINSANATIMTNFEEHRSAQNKQPTPYPRLVTKLIPRLGRVASRVEKLFWFGSHRFFLWCVEFVLFFSTVLLAAASAGMSLIPVAGKKIAPLNVVALTLAAVNLVFVLLRIAVIMKRYIFILHNASLIPEVVAIEAIHNVRDKRVVRDDASSASGSETDMEEADAARERRRRLGRFFRSEAECGNVPGIEGSSRNSRSSWDFPARLRRRRRVALQRRKGRKSFPIGSPPDIVSNEEDNKNLDSAVVSNTDNTSSSNGPDGSSVGLKDHGE